MFKTKNLSIISQYLFDLIDLARSLQASELCEKKHTAVLCVDKNQ